MRALVTFCWVAWSATAWVPSVEAQAVEEEVEEGGAMLSPEDLAPPDAASPAEPDAREVSEPEDPVIEPAPPLDDDPIQLVLENGLRVVLQPVPGRRFAAVGVSYAVGSGDVPSGWTGLAHLTEHLMFSGTDVLDDVAVYRRLEAAGAVVRNAITTVDRTTYYEVLPVRTMEQALWIESHRMARVLRGLDRARLERQRDVVLHEGWERNLYGWRGVMHQQRYVGVFPEGHPYTRFVEREDDVRAIRLPHVQWFFQQHYGPDDATLIVVGGFDVDRVRASIERHFSPIVRSAPAPTPVAPPPVAPLPRERRIAVRIQHDRDQVEVAWPTPALFDDGDAALDVLSELLVERRESPLFAGLVESGIALDLNARQYSHDHGSVFVIAAVPARGHTTDECLAAIDAAMEQVRRQPFDAEAVERARGDWARVVRLDAEDLGARLGLLAASRGGYVPTVEHERDRYLAVDADAVARVVRDWLPADRRLVLVGRADPLAPPGAQIVSDEGRPER
ncbi:MAG: insulinase family protein [Sandaracinaceae bacterium]|nr:insulinase family protein [Sandaracinaceae bacterium]